MDANAKSLMILSSIAECRKAIDFLTEVGEIGATTIMLNGAKRPCPGQPASGTPMFRGHQLVLRDDKTLVCSVCGRKYRSSHQELTKVERYAHERLLPSCPF